MTANNNVRACLISWVHVSKCLHIAACFMSDLSGGHTAVRSHALTHVETLKYTRRLSLQAYLAPACTWGQRGEKINKIQRDCPLNYQNEEEGYVSGAAAPEVVLLLFNLVRNLQCPSLTGNAVYHRDDTRRGDICGTSLPQITRRVWRPGSALFLILNRAGKSPKIKGGRFARWLCKVHKSESWSPGSSC